MTTWKIPHIEHRICGTDANPYLAAAAILVGIHRGIREQRDPDAPIEGNGYAQASEPLPTDWLTSLRPLESSTGARQAFGSEFLACIWRLNAPNTAGSWGSWANRTGAGV